MSLIRFSRPGLPTEFVDEGPNHAHVSARMGIRGGSGNPILTDGYVRGVSNRDQAIRQTREYKAREAEKARARRAR